MSNEIADSDGASTKVLTIDSDANKAERCLSCEEWAVKYAKLNERFKESQGEVVLCRRRVDALLLPFTTGDGFLRKL